MMDRRTPLLLVLTLLPACSCVSRDATGDPAALGGFERDVLYELRQDVQLFFRKERESENLPEYALVPPLPAGADARARREYETETRGAEAVATIPAGARLRINSVRLYACRDFKETIVFGRLFEGPHSEEPVSINALSTAIVDHVSEVVARNPDPRYLGLPAGPGRDGQ